MAKNISLTGDEMLLVRADANAAMGMGHVMRCLALGQYWRRAGGRVQFVGNIDDNSIQKRLRQSGFEFVFLKTHHPDPRDLEKTLQILNRCRSDVSWTVVDGYHLGPEYQKTLRTSGNRLLVWDDYNHHKSYCADMILNQNLGAENILYTTEQPTVKLLGKDYIVLRREFLDKSQPGGGDTDSFRLLITFGGADPENATSKVVQALHRLDIHPMEIAVVIGANNPNAAAVRKSCDSLGRHLVRVVKDPYMPAMMSWADIAISSSGTTAWELMYMGVPTLLIVLAENQKEIAEGLHQRHAAWNIGDIHAIVPDTIADSVKRLRDETGLRHEMSLTASRLVDGRGAERVIQAMMGSGQ